MFLSASIVRPLVPPSPHPLPRIRISPQQKAFAQQLGVHSCAPDTKELKDLHVADPPKTASWYTFTNPITRAGGGDDYATRCREAQADTAFLFFGMACFFGSLALDFFVGGGGGGGGGRGFSVKVPGRKSAGGGGASYV